MDNDELKPFVIHSHDDDEDQGADTDNEEVLEVSNFQENEEQTHSISHQPHQDTQPELGEERDNRSEAGEQEPGYTPAEERVDNQETSSAAAEENVHEPVSAGRQSVFHIEVDKINPNPHQPRREFNEGSLRDLANSIREYGVIQPLVVSKIVRETESGFQVYYELIAGERRLMASKLVGLRTVPVIIRKEGDDREKLELAIIENIQRENLNPIESAKAFARLQDEFKLTQREIGARLGKSREVIANSVRLLNLPSEIQGAVSEGRINESQARLLLSVEDIPTQRELFRDILRDNLSVRDVRRRVAGIKNADSAAEETPAKTANPEVLAIKEKLEEILGTKVEVRQDGERGKITINFYSHEELQSIIDKILHEHDLG